MRKGLRISFALTKEYEVFIDKEEIDKEYGGDVSEAIKDRIKEAVSIDEYLEDIEVLEEEFEYQDVLYDERLQDEYQAEKELQESQYYRDLI